MRTAYLPNDQSFKSGLPEGKTILAPESHKGKTRRERGKQAARATRIRERSRKNLQEKGK